MEIKGKYLKGWTTGDIDNWVEVLEPLGINIAIDPTIDYDCDGSGIVYWPCDPNGCVVIEVSANGKINNYYKEEI